MTMMRVQFCLMAIGLCVLVAAGAGATPANVMVIRAAGQLDSYNVPFVSVTICETENPKKCQTIDNVQLDSGSTGLRIFSSLVKLSLKSETTAEGANVGECQIWGGKDMFWGAVKMANVVLGGETAMNVPIQMIDRKFAAIPPSCGRSDGDPKGAGINGILGINPGKTDCSGKSVCNIDSTEYFACTQDSCKTMSANTPVGLQISNPIMFLPSDNNGFLVSFPPLRNAVVNEVVGQLILGVGTRVNNTPTAAERASLNVIGTQPDGYIQVNVLGKTYSGLLDTGTGKWIFPKEALPVCTQMPCMEDPVGKSAPITVIGADGAAKGAFIADFGTDLDRQAWMRGDGPIFTGLSDFSKNYFTAGFPFFIGRTVYFVIDGKSSALGQGPLDAF